MGDTTVPPTGLELQIAQEAAELAAVPKIPIIHFMGGPGKRCHICGKLCNQDDLKPYETQQTQWGPLQRMACPDCHPQRGFNGAT